MSWKVSSWGKWVNLRPWDGKQVIESLKEAPSRKGFHSKHEHAANVPCVHHTSSGSAHTHTGCPHSGLLAQQTLQEPLPTHRQQIQTHTQTALDIHNTVPPQILQSKQQPYINICMSHESHMTHHTRGPTTLLRAVSMPKGLIANGMSRKVSLLKLSWPHCRAQAGWHSTYVRMPHASTVH